MRAKRAPYRRAVVRILKSDAGEQFVGLGLRLADHLILTCAHVLARALDASAEGSRPRGQVRVRTAVGNRDLGLASILDGGWFPKCESKQIDEPADIALLEIKSVSRLPGPAVFSNALTLSGIECELLGAPEGYTEELVRKSAAIEIRPSLIRRLSIALVVVVLLFQGAHPGHLLRDFLRLPEAMPMAW